MPGTGLPRPKRAATPKPKPKPAPVRTPAPRPPTPRQPSPASQPRTAQAQSPAARNPGAGPLEGHDPLSYVPDSPPDASFPTNPSYTSYTGLDTEWSPDASMTAQAASLQRRQQEAGQRDFDQLRGDIQHDLAKQLEALNQRRAWQTEDARRKVDEYQRQLPISQRKLGSQYAGRGLASSGAKSEAQGEVARQTDEAVMGTERALDRDMAEAARQEGAAKNEAARAERELNDSIEADRLQQEAAELQEKVASAKDAHSRAQALAKAQKAGVEAKRSEASAWMGARVNELMNSGLSEDQARSTSLSEARQFFTGVPDTYLAGRFAPAKAGKEKKPYELISQERYGKTISPESGRSLDKKMVSTIKRSPIYQQIRPQLDAYRRAAGSQANPVGFLDFLEAHLQRLNPDAKKAEIRAQMAAKSRTFSLLMAEGSF